MVRMVGGKARPFGDDKKPGGGGAKLFVAAVGTVTVVGAGGVGIGGLGLGSSTSGGAAAESLAGNSAGDVADGLPGRDLRARTSEGRKSARRGKSDEAWSKMALKKLKRQVREEIKQARCAETATGQVRAFLRETPCTSMVRMVFPLGDGHGNAAAVSVVWVGFSTRARAESFERVEREQGAGDVRPLGAEVLGLSGVHFTGYHYGSHRERTIMAVAEAETITGRLADATLNAIADVSAWLPRP